MTSPVQPGEILAGKYKVERVLGVGGMGVVVSALHTELEERVAIKFMLEEALANQEAVERFGREARAAVRIKSEHVARVIDVGKLDNGAPYMVMEYLEGGDLSDLLEKKGPLPVEEAAGYILQACEAIAEAHALGIVHRDLKPGNLFLADRPDGTRKIKVLDFGISKTTGRGSKSEMSLTKTSTVMGSPLYMSPEQMRATKTADMRSDIWALGVILHELISGKTVFDAPTMPELVARILADEPEPLSKAKPGVSPGIEAVVKRCLEKSPDKRYQTIAEFAAALADHGPKGSFTSVERIRGVLDKAGIVSEPRTDDGPRVAPAATMGNWGTARIPAQKGSSRTVVIGFAAALVLGGIATAFMLRSGGTQPPPVPAASGLPAAEKPAQPATSVSASATVEPEIAPATASVTASAAVPPPATGSAAAHPVAAANTKAGATSKPGNTTAGTAKTTTKKSSADLFADPK